MWPMRPGSGLKQTEGETLVACLRAGLGIMAACARLLFLACWPLPLEFPSRCRMACMREFTISREPSQSTPRISKPVSPWESVKRTRHHQAGHYGVGLRRGGARASEVDRTPYADGCERFPGPAYWPAKSQTVFQLPLKDVVHLMIEVSDNTATNMI